MKLNDIYTQFDEDLRLSHSQASRVEFYTTLHFIKKYIRCDDRVLDIGAGTGVYTRALAELGHKVTAVEPALPNLEQLYEKFRLHDQIEIMEGNAMDLSMFEDSTFDFVLCLGPLYHLSSAEEKLRCIKEAKRVCKKDGIIFFAYISNDMVFVTETMLYNPNFLSSAHYAPDFKVNDGPFCFMTVRQMRQLMKICGLEKISQFAADGLSELLADKINLMSDKQYQEWLRFHMYTCEKHECLGYSHHLVTIIKNTKG